MIKELKSVKPLLLILLLAGLLRFTGVNWDQGQHLHPDERFLTMVTNSLKWPTSLGDYLDSSTSPMNPHNQNWGFYVYGTMPVFFVKLVADLTHTNNYGDVTIIGRQLSAFVDMGTVLLVFLITKSLVSSIKKKNFFTFLNPPLIASFLYGVSVTPIQLSHFYAADPYLTFFTALSFYFICRMVREKNETKKESKKFLNNPYVLSSLSGVAFGLALASKISGIYFAPILGLILIASAWNLRQRFIQNLIIWGALLGLCTYVAFRLTNPYLFAHPYLLDISLNPKVLNNWKELKSFDGPEVWFPPSIQWMKTKAYVFPLKNYLFWGVGLPYGILSVLAIGYSALHVARIIVKRKLRFLLTPYNLLLTCCLLWILGLFAYQGAQFTKPLRYFYVLYPFIAILSGIVLSKLLQIISHKSSYRIGFWAYVIICLLLLVYPISFVTIYTRPNTRVEASEWIYQHIPGPVVKSTEHWDDGLPMSSPKYNLGDYKSEEFPLYGADTPEKWRDMDQKLRRVDYIFLTSNRLYGSIMTRPDRYPITTRYYQMLFDGRLGFEILAQFSSRPNLPLPGFKICLTPPFVRYGIVALPTQECDLEGISFVDDYADETFTVYDHPAVTIFRKIRSVDYYSLLYSSH